jgi:ribosomal protein L44E
MSIQRNCWEKDHTTLSWRYECYVCGKSDIRKRMGNGYCSSNEKHPIEAKYYCANCRKAYIDVYDKKKEEITPIAKEYL